MSNSLWKFVSLKPVIPFSLVEKGGIKDGHGDAENKETCKKKGSE